MQPLKIVVIGPVQSGKTTISNFLADATEMPYDYHPTQGVRILEFDIHTAGKDNKNISVDVELWDCSGDHKFQICWPAMRKNLHGIVLVYSEKSNNCLKQMQQLYDYFIEQTKLGPDRCVIFCFDPEKRIPEISKIISSTFAKVSHVRCNVQEGGDKLKADFSSFVSSLMTKTQNQKGRAVTGDSIYVN